MVPVALADEDSGHRPTARITTPQNNTQFDGGQKVTFVAEVFNEDGDEVIAIWSADGQEVERYRFSNGTGVHQWTMVLKGGHTYIFELNISDGDLESHYIGDQIRGPPGLGA